MDKIGNSELSDILDHDNPSAVFDWWHQISSLMYPDVPFSLVDKVFPLVADLYAGRFPRYTACRTNYHDYRHTIDVFVATVRLSDGLQLSGTQLSPDLVEDIVCAALFHDVGYIQKDDDTFGTGAKYTATHVVRSVEFLKQYKDTFEIDPERADRMGRIIMGTDLAIPWDKLDIHGKTENTATSILAAADLLGQMADRAYLEKLLFLYYEFKEAGIGGYESAFDILRKTAGFYTAVKGRLETKLGDVSGASRSHFAKRVSIDRDLYRESIAHQMAYLDEIMDDDSVNFRKRLRRMDLEAVEMAERQRLASYGVAAAFDTL